MIKENYLSQLEEINIGLKNMEEQLDKLGWLRVGSFLLGIGSIIAGFEFNNNLGYIGGILLLAIFIVLVRRYSQIRTEKAYESAKKEVIENDMKRLGQEWLNFEEDGSLYIKEELPRIKDLDLLGKGSLFQYICVAHTPYGKESLARALTVGNAREQIARRQKAVKELLEDKKFSLHLKTLSQLIGKDVEGVEPETIEGFIQVTEQNIKKQGSILKIGSLLLPFIVIFSSTLLILQRQTPLTNLLGSLSLITQLGLGILYSQKHNLIFDPIIKFCKNIKAYEAFLYAIENKDFKCDYLKELKDSLCYEGGPKKALKGLNRLTELLKIRFNGLGYMVVGSMLMWDFHCMDAFYSWHKQYGKTVRRWLKVMGEIEALLSLAVIGEIKEEWHFPEIEESKEPFVVFENLKHPLIQEQVAVGNDLEIGSATCIITGSNMSGKTTFLRTIGINLALAYAGAPILGTHLRAAHMEVLTSMRTQDNVNEGISTFYAELLRIKEIITKAEMKQPMLVLIDEIFKGTNSADRILGATETIHALEKEWITAMVSTHDFELCDLENNSKRKAYNYHFTEHYKDNEIQFSYKLQKGRCKTTNAKYLLRMVGIIK